MFDFARRCITADVEGVPSTRLVKELVVGVAGNLFDRKSVFGLLAALCSVSAHQELELIG